MPLAIRNLRVAYGPIVAVHGFSVEVQPGSVVAVIGPNGAGKSSLLSAIGGQTRHEGEVVLDGEALQSRAPHRRSRAGLGYVPSGRGVFPTLSVRSHVRIAAGANDAAMWERLSRWFPLLEEKRDALGSNLSGGQQQTVSIARAMATGPRYMLMDEPSIGLSPIAIEHLSAAVRMLKEQSVGILLTEQNAGLAMMLADYCLLMVRGEVRLDGTPAQLRNHPEVEALYLGRSVEKKS